jgi:hypothetical protein
MTSVATACFRISTLLSAGLRMTVMRAACVVETIGYRVEPGNAQSTADARPRPFAVECR